MGAKICAASSGVASTASQMVEANATQRMCLLPAGSQISFATPIAFAAGDKEETLLDQGRILIDIDRQSGIESAASFAGPFTVVKGLCIFTDDDDTDPEDDLIISTADGQQFYLDVSNNNSATAIATYADFKTIGTVLVKNSP